MIPLAFGELPHLGTARESHRVLLNVFVNILMIVDDLEAVTFAEAAAESPVFLLPAADQHLATHLDLHPFGVLILA